MSSSRLLLNNTQTVTAAYMAGQHATVEEICSEVGVKDPNAVRITMKYYNIDMSPKPFGFRPVTVNLSPAQVDGLREVARAQGILGVGSHQKLLEQAARRLAADPALLRSILDPNMQPIFVDVDMLDGLKQEADKRAMRPEVLAGSLLAYIAKDSMYGAVIDDGELA